MVDRKEGCRVEVALKCLDEEGREISNIPGDGSGWGGFDRYEANVLAISLSQAVLGVIAAVNEEKNGPAKGTPAKR